MLGVGKKEKKVGRSYKYKHKKWDKHLVINYFCYTKMKYNNPRVQDEVLTRSVNNHRIMLNLESSL